MKSPSERAQDHDPPKLLAEPPLPPSNSEFQNRERRWLPPKEQYPAFDFKRRDVTHSGLRCASRRARADVGVGFSPTGR